jgi:hypothetical protein
MRFPIRIDYVLFFAGLCIGLLGCAEVHFAATGVHSPAAGVFGYLLLVVGTVLFLGGMWLLARPVKEEDGINTFGLAIAPGPTLITAAIGRLGAHLRNGDALWARVALVGTGTFLSALWISWLIDGVHHIPAKDNPRAVLWGLCMQLGIACFMWASIKPTSSAVVSVAPKDEAGKENRSSEISP